MSRTKNATRNIVWGTVNKLICLFVPFVLRTLMIRILGVEYVGIGTLFTSILNVLNLAELGVSSAIVYNLYGAIATENDDLICALMNLYRKIYRIIGCIVLLIGVLLTPVLKYLVSGTVPDGVNLYILYYIYLIQTCLTYFMFAYKSCLFMANQRTDVTSIISTIVFVLQYVCQALGLLILKSYYVYAIFIPITTLIINIVQAVVVDKLYPSYRPGGSLDDKILKSIKKKVKSLFLYRIGSTVLISADSIVISAFLGLEELGIYNNYYYIVNTLFSFLAIIYSSMTASVGNSLIMDTLEKNKSDFDRLLMLEGFIVSWCATCMLCLYQCFIEVWVGEELLLPFGMVICFTVYFYVWRMMDVVNLYKDAAGLWEYDKFRPLVAAAVNLILNIILVMYIGLYGILISTIASIVVIIMPWSTYVLFKHLFNQSMRNDLVTYFFKLFMFFIITVAVSVVTYFICELIKNVSLLGLFLKFVVCMCVCTTLYIFFFSFFKDFRSTKSWIITKLRSLVSRGTNEKNNC